MQTVSIPVSTFPKIVIIGGGFGGMTLAKELKNKNFEVILIDRNNYHTFQPLLYQVATGGLEADSIAYPLRKIFQRAKNVFFRMAEVSDIDTVSKIVHTDIGDISYEYLVIATGTTNNFFGNADLQKYSMPIKSLTQALDIRSLLLQNLEMAINSPEKKEACLNFIVAGGGPTGVEISGALGELRRHVLPCDYHELKKEDIHIYLIEGDKEVLANMSDPASAKALKFLNELGVKVRLNTRLNSYNGEVAELNDGTKIPSYTLIWSAGVTGQLVNGIPADKIQKGNRIAVNRFNMIEGMKDVFAIGDIAVMTEEKYPKGHPQVAPVAMQQAKLLAKNLSRIIANQKPDEFKYFDKGSMATVGRNRAVVDLSFIRFQGIFAWFAWMFVHLMTLVGFRNRVIVFINWIWNYFSYDRAIRLIVRPFKRK